MERTFGVQSAGESAVAAAGSAATTAVATASSGPNYVHLPVSSRKCLNGHALEPFLTQKLGFGCDGCGVAVGSGSTLHRCHGCDFDLCEVKHFPILDVI